MELGIYTLQNSLLVVLIDVRKPWGRNETDSCRQAALTKLVEQLHSAFCSISAFGQIWPLLGFNRNPEDRLVVGVVGYLYRTIFHTGKEYYSSDVGKDREFEGV